MRVFEASPNSVWVGHMETCRCSVRLGLHANCAAPTLKTAQYVHSFPNGGFRFLQSCLTEKYETGGRVEAVTSARDKNTSMAVCAVIIGTLEA